MTGMVPPSSTVGGVGLRLRLRVPAEEIVAFSPLLQAGFRVTARTGCSVKTLLCGQFGIDEEYVTRRITTMFLNYRPVDNMDATLVRDGATLALSCAMPGLVGATLRRGGFYAAFRQGISCRDEDTDTQSGIGTVRIKLFNLLIAELGPLFLGRGILVPASSVKELVDKGSTALRDACAEVAVDGNPVKMAVLAEGTPLRSGDEVRLTVVFDEPLPAPEE